MHITIGTRGSDLALKQSEIVRQKLLSTDPSLTVELKVIKTEGDVNASPIPLDTVGKGWFTKEIENELLSGTIDLAVHSLKDLPEALPKGLRLGAFPEREDPRDVLVSKKNLTLKELPGGAIVGTDSLRRKVQILAVRPDLVVKSLRGNVPTRVKKLETEDYDAIVIAAAGLLRLGMEGRIAEYFDAEAMMPAPGQGILAVELREGDGELATLVRKIDHRETSLVAKAERAFARRAGGGCKEPVGAHAGITGKTITLQGMLATDDGARIVRGNTSGGAKDGVTLAEALAARLLGELGENDAHA